MVPDVIHKAAIDIDDVSRIDTGFTIVGLHKAREAKTASVAGSAHGTQNFLRLLAGAVDQHVALELFAVNEAEKCVMRAEHEKKGDGDRHRVGAVPDENSREQYKQGAHGQGREYKSTRRAPK